MTEEQIQAAIDRALAEAPDLRPEQRRTLARLFVVRDEDEATSHILDEED